MATELVGSKQTIYQEDVDFLSANSEAVQTKVAKAALFSQNIAEYPVNFNYSGYFINGAITDGAESYIITKRSTIKRYFMRVDKTGTASFTALNVKIYNSSGVFVSDLFTSGATGVRITRSGTTVDRVYVGRNIDEATTFNSTSAGVTFQYGTPNLTILEEGYQLRGEIVSNGTNALHAQLGLVLQRLE